MYALAWRSQPSGLSVTRFCSLGSLSKRSKQNLELINPHASSGLLCSFCCLFYLLWIYSIKCTISAYASLAGNTFVKLCNHDYHYLFPQVSITLNRSSATIKQCPAPGPSDPYSAFLLSDSSYTGCLLQMGQCSS